ncbi:MAG: hypothetical protein V1743_05570 [Nanoarchaeota archaeon]
MSLERKVTQEMVERVKQAGLEYFRLHYDVSIQEINAVEKKVRSIGAAVGGSIGIATGVYFGIKEHDANMGTKASVLLGYLGAHIGLAIGWMIPVPDWYIKNQKAKAFAQTLELRATEMLSQDAEKFSYDTTQVSSTEHEAVLISYISQLLAEKDGEKICTMLKRLDNEAESYARKMIKKHLDRCDDLELASYIPLLEEKHTLRLARAYITAGKNQELKTLMSI